MKPRLYSLFADTPIKGTEFLKYAQSQPDETQFAKDFSNLAFQFMQDRAPALMKYILGFEVVDRTENGTRAVGIFGFKIDGDYYYVPAFFMNNQIKGVDSILSKKTNSFVPLTEDWVNYIINRKATELGSESKKPIKPEQDEFENPTFDFLRRPTVGPLGGSKFASADSPWSFSEAWNVIKKDIEKRAACDPEFKKSFMGSFLSFSGVRSPLEKEASSPIQEFIQSVGGPKAERTFMKALKNIKTANAALEFYTGPSAFHVDRYPNSGRDCYLLRKQAQEASLTSIKIEVTSDPSNDDEAREIIEDGFTIHDNREPEQKSDVIQSDYESSFQNPDRPGVYNVLVNGGVTKKAYVLDLDRLFQKGRNRVVYFPDNKQVIFAKNRNILCDGGAIGNVSSIRDDASNISNCSIDSVYLFVGKNGSVLPPFRIGRFSKNSGERPNISGSFNYVSSYEPLDNDDDFANYWKYDNYHNRDGSLKSDTCFINNVELADFTGSPKSSAGTVIIPSDWKSLETREMSLDEEGYRLASIDSLSNELRKQGAAKLEVLSDDGLDYYIRFDNSGFTSPMNYKKACINLVTRLGIDNKDAKKLLKTASSNKKVKCLVKLGQMVGVQSQMPPEQTPEVDPYTGIPVYQSPYVDRTIMPFDGNDTSVSEDNEIGENIGGDISNQSNGSGEAEFDEEAAQLAQQAGQLGQKDVFDKAAIGGLAKVYDTGAVIDSYLPEFIQAVDRIGRVLFLYYWKHDDFVQRYGTDNVIEMEESLKNIFKNLGKLTLDLKKKAVGGGDADSELDTI